MDNIIVTTNHVSNYFDNGRVNIEFNTYTHACLWCEAALLDLYKANPIAAHQKYFDVSHAQTLVANAAPYMIEHATISMRNGDIYYDDMPFFPNVVFNRTLTPYTVRRINVDIAGLWQAVAMTTDLTSAVHAARASLYELRDISFYYAIESASGVVGYLAWDSSGQFVFYDKELWLIYSDVSKRPLTIANVSRRNIHVVREWYKQYYSNYKCMFYNLVDGQRIYE